MKEIRAVGVIGLGKMGMPMARLLRERGFTVIGYDVTLPAIKVASGLGVQPVNSPKAVAAASDLTIIAVGFDSEVEAVMFGDNGALAGAWTAALLRLLRLSRLPPCASCSGDPPAAPA
jgi:3-hydroxyisobutyrate dehydrogenase-like beta-hydroxyacid dehydrogenase